VEEPGKKPESKKKDSNKTTGYLKKVFARRPFFMTKSYRFIAIENILTIFKTIKLISTTSHDFTR
jgi:hypothetical protein